MDEVPDQGFDPVSLAPEAREPYETGDFLAWTQQQAALLKARRVNEIDWDGIAEEIESLGKRDRRELLSRLTVLLMHLLKWRHQPQGRSHSWRSTIREQRRQVLKLLNDSPSLRAVAAAALATCHADAVIDAADETGLPATTFPDACPFTLDEILDPDYWPLPFPEDAP
jgi:hypothetical protein